MIYDKLKNFTIIKFIGIFSLVMIFLSACCADSDYYKRQQKINSKKSFFQLVPVPKNNSDIILPKRKIEYDITLNKNKVSNNIENNKEKNIEKNKENNTENTSEVDILPPHLHMHPASSIEEDFNTIF
ncbi:hypothetical protein [Candidatus Palibaumannia cicadellinicola]|uniref:Lipoprotein n=1 Tax=Candidatus Palibaumannia cicadellinicola TaxID=186490 RepID=A0A0K2BKW0_9GAMM|nr:hypothetical protein [Candidatus Baumannia cicadellinicola]AKZ65683.1 hypothetical protein AB162_055 [Candidatus Baumannia cicadellinicola]